jgi:tetratricopeptide (TPR) repeat protein
VLLHIALAALVVHQALHPSEETDLFFRLATGEQILQQRALVRQNLFSFTHPNHPYFDSAWLFDVAAALLHRVGGFTALVFAKTAWLIAVFAGAFVLARRKGAHAVIGAAVLALTTWLVEPRMVERPHVLSFGFEVALLAVLHAARQRVGWLVLAVPLTALWANLHAGAFLAPVILAAAAAGARIDRWRSLPAADAPRSLPLAVAALAAALALVATPVGTAIFRYLGFHVDINAVHPVDEFRAPDLESDLGFFVGLAATLVVLIAWPRRVPRPVRELLPLVVVAALACRYVRFAADFALLSAPLVAARASALLEIWREHAARPETPRTQRWTSPVPVTALLAATIALALGVRTTTAFFAGKDGGLHAGLAPRLFPESALAFIDGNQLGARMYNDFEIGGYLAWRWFPRHRVFVDPRLPAYPHAFHTLLGRSDLTREQWEAAMRDFGVQSALITHAGINPRAAWWDPRRWALVFRQDDARVFVRRIPQWQALIAAHEIPATFTYNDATGTATVVLEQAPAGSPVAPCEWDLRRGDLFFDLDDGNDRRAIAAYQQALGAPADCLSPARRRSALAWTAAALVRQQRWEKALHLLDEAVATTPTTEGTAAEDTIALHANRAVALEALRRTDDAAGAWNHVAKHSRDSDLRRKAARRAEALRSSLR